MALSVKAFPCMHHISWLQCKEVPCTVLQNRSPGKYDRFTIANKLRTLGTGRLTTTGAGRGAIERGVVERGRGRPARAGAQSRRDGDQSRSPYDQAGGARRPAACSNLKHVRCAQCSGGML